MLMRIRVLGADFGAKFPGDPLAVVRAAPLPGDPKDMTRG